jgi:endoglucanase
MNAKLLENLCNLHGGSGDEDKIRDFIYENIRENVDEIRVDNLGNLIAYKKGSDNEKMKIALTAHMDEVSFIVTAYRDDGTVKFAPVGGINADSVLGRRIVSNGFHGVIGSKAIHNMTEKEQQKAGDFDDFSLDFGFLTKEECQEKIALGDRVYFEENFLLFGNDMVASKALDDRFGCAVLISLIKKKFPCDITFAFLTQEEVGCRGAKAADIDADIAIVIETTTAADFDGVSGDKKCTRIGEGAVVTFMDRGTIYDKDLYKLTRETADENGIKNQTKTLIAGGNDASALNIKNGGMKTIAISIPCRYLHTANCVASILDMDSVLLLAEKMIEKCAAK